MPLPVYEAAAVELLSRLATCTVANGYTYEALQVARISAKPLDFAAGTVLLWTDSIDPAGESEGATGLLEQTARYFVLAIVEQIDGTANDAQASQAVRDLVHSLDLEDGGGLWLRGRVSSIEHLDPSSGDHAGATIGVELLLRSDVRSLDLGP